MLCRELINILLILYLLCSFRDILGLWSVFNRRAGKFTWILFFTKVETPSSSSLVVWTLYSLYYFRYFTIYYFGRVFCLFEVVVLQFILHLVFWVIFILCWLTEVDNDEPNSGIDKPLRIFAIELKFNIFFFPKGLLK